MMVGTMTELKRRHESLDHSSGICNTVKRHKTQGSISMRERKEKLGEKIAALQQLVSPFGKTDTASVLLEAMGYIKFLQEQVQVLSAPYLQSAPSGKLQESEYYSLQRRGLCLVPITWTIKSSPKQRCRYMGTCHEKHSKVTADGGSHQLLRNCTLEGPESPSIHLPA